MASRISIAVWSAVLQWSRVSVNAIVFVLLSRWLSLSDIGVVAALQAPVLLLQVVQSSVMPDAVVQEGEMEPFKISTLFWISVGSGLAITGLLFATAPLITTVIKHPEGMSILLVLSICPLIWSLGAVSEGLLRKSLNTKRLAIRTALASVIAAGGSLYMGVMGHGAWALVFFTVGNAVASTTMTLIAANWRPQCTFSTAYARAITPKILALAGRYALSSAVFPMLQFSVSSALGLAAGGAFQIACRLYSVVDSVAITPYRFLILPTFSRNKGDKVLLGRNTIKAIAVGGVISSPIYLGLASIAALLLPLVVGPTNGPSAALIFSIVCLYGPFAMMIGIVNHALTAQGEAVVVFKRSLLLYILVIIPCIVAARMSLEVMGLIYSVWGGVIGVFAALVMARRRLDIEVLPMLRAFGLPFVAGCGMVAAVWALGMATGGMSGTSVGLEAWGRVAMLIAVGGLAYALLMFVLAREQIKILLNVVGSRGR